MIEECAERLSDEDVDALCELVAAHLGGVGGEGNGNGNGNEEDAAGLAEAAAAGVAAAAASSGGSKG